MAASELRHAWMVCKDFHPLLALPVAQSCVEDAMWRSLHLIMLSRMRHGRIPESVICQTQLVLQHIH